MLYFNHTPIKSISDVEAVVRKCLEYTEVRVVVGEASVRIFTPAHDTFGNLPKAKTFFRTIKMK